jgi:hypothetical protein
MKKRLAAAALLILTFFAPVSAASDIPMTIDGQINCAHPDNAITTTCRGEAPPPPVNTPPVPTVTYEAPAPGSTMTYFGDQSADCSLEANKSLAMCIPMTINGEINCANSANAITTTCWERAQSEKAAGKEDSSGVDCKDERFKDYPICTGIKPQAVVDYEKSQEVTKTNLDQLNQDSATVIAEPEVEKVAGTVEVKNRNAKKTSFLIDLENSGVKVEVIATKKGSKTIKRTVTTNAEGEKLVAFGKNLKGYTIKILVNGEVIDRVKL